MIYLKNIWLKILIIVIVALALIAGRLIVSGFSKMQSGNKGALSAAPAVTVATVETRNTTRQFEANARIIAKYRVDVLARISGYLTQSYFKEGDYVKKGQVLFLIEPNEYEIAVKNAQAALNATQASLINAEKNLKQ